MDYYNRTGPDGYSQAERDEEHFNHLFRWERHIQAKILEDLATPHHSGWTGLIHERLKAIGLDLSEDEVFSACIALEGRGRIIGERVLGQGIKWTLPQNGEV